MSKLENLIKNKKGLNLESHLVEVPEIKVEKTLRDKLKDTRGKVKVCQRTFRLNEKETIIFNEAASALNIKADNDLFVKYATDLMAIEVLAQDNKKIKVMLDNIKLELFKQIGDVL